MQWHQHEPPLPLLLWWSGWVAQQTRHPLSLPLPLLLLLLSLLVLLQLLLLLRWCGWVAQLNPLLLC